MTASDVREPAWTLPTRHPDLCPGEGQDTHAGPPLCWGTCPQCGTQMGMHHWPTAVGGARVPRHYKPSLFEEAT